MTLENKLSSRSESPIDKFDNFMINKFSNLGILYQNLTGKSYRNLVDSFYKSGRNISAAFIPLTLFIGAHATKTCDIIYKNAKFETPTEEELRHKAAGRPKKIGRYARLIPPLVGAALTGFGISCIEDPMGPIDFYGGIGVMATGLSLAPIAMADYLSKSSLPEELA